MELNKKEYNINNAAGFKKPEQYTSDIDGIMSGVDIVLADYKKFYVLAKMYPQNEEYQQQFSNINDKLKQIIAKLFTISNELQSNINKISEKLKSDDIVITKERVKNKELKIRLGYAHNENNASTEMISNYKENYDVRYLRNWGLVLSALIGILAIRVVYKKQEV